MSAMMSTRPLKIRDAKVIKDTNNTKLYCPMIIGSTFTHCKVDCAWFWVSSEDGNDLLMCKKHVMGRLIR